RGATADLRVVFVPGHLSARARRRPRLACGRFGGGGLRVVRRRAAGRAAGEHPRAQREQPQCRSAHLHSFSLRSSLPVRTGACDLTAGKGATMAVLLPIFIIGFVLLLSGLRVAQEYQRGVVFRLGRYMGLRGPGLFWIVPLGIERVVTIDIRTRTVS